MSMARRNGRASAVATVTVPVRCGIYTRKSTDEGLDKDFNSLDAQREMAEAYITSQRGEGWIAVPDRYDDGGYSGATTNRPALQRLLSDIEAGKIDCVVVYRYDRVSRSLLDFLQLLEFLKRHDVGFVSISERFDTSTPHGEMALNMVLSVAQCERRVIGQRTRDKLAASRRKGKYVGGYPVLGYDRDPAGGRLVVNKDEAETVREVFRLFLERRSLVEVSAELTRRGITLKRWTTRDGKVFGGGRFDKVNLRRMLTNHLHIGKVLFEGKVYDGEHEGIVPPKVFREVQAVLEENRGNGGAGSRNQCGALLRGILKCASCNAPMVHTWTKHRAKAYRWYRCAASMKHGTATCPTRSVKADAVESFIVSEIKRIGSDPDLQRATFEQALAQVAAQKRGARAEMKRIEKEIASARRNVDGLTAAIAKAGGRAEQALLTSLETTQGRVTALEARLAEVRAQEATLATQHVDEAAVAQALAEFDELWSVLLIPERERVIRLLVSGIRYDGSTGNLDIDWRLAGFGELAGEVGDA